MKKYFETVITSTIALAMMLINQYYSTDGEIIMTWIHDVLYNNITEMSYDMATMIALLCGVVVYSIVAAFVVCGVKEVFSKKYFTKKEQTKACWITAD